jgi:hypothetical protein
MKFLYIVATLVFLLETISTVQAGEDKTILPLATCQESWLDWQKQDSEKAKRFFDEFQSNFRKDDHQNFYVPVQPTSILGHEISSVFPDSVGMAVGFSVGVNANFETLKSSLEKQTGKAFKQCDASTDENIKSCQYEIGKNKTLMIMANSQGKDTQSLFGCYYYYAK